MGDNARNLISSSETGTNTEINFEQHDEGINIFPSDYDEPVQVRVEDEHIDTIEDPTETIYLDGSEFGDGGTIEFTMKITIN